MTNNLKHSSVARNAKADALARLLDGGYLLIYSGVQPANADTALGGSNILLAECRFANPSAPAAVNGVISFDALIGDASCDASGTATFFRAIGGDGTTVVLDGTVQEGGGDMNINKAALVAGAPLNITSITYTIPEGI